MLGIFSQALSTRDYGIKLRKLGIETDTTDIFTSADAMIEYLRDEMPDTRRLFVLGTPSLLEQFSTCGYTVCDDDPEAVVVGFDTSLVYRRLCLAAYWIAQGKPFLATHPDLICPTNDRTVLVDCGSICVALERATGRKPLAVPGKPDRRMIRGVLKRHNLEPAQLAVVGDRLYTDMAMARQAGTLGVLVLSGETTAEQVAACKSPPELVVQDLAEFGRLLENKRRLHDAEPTLRK